MSKQPVRFIVRELIDPATGAKIGALVPASEVDRQEMRRRKLRTGAWVRCDMTMPRNPKFNGLVHVFGEMIANNIPSFSGMQPHGVLKRLQLEAGVECQYKGVLVNAIWPDLVKGAEAMLPGAGLAMSLIGDRLSGQVIEVRETKSMSFDSMDEVTFRGVMNALYAWVADRYWPDCTASEIERMAEVYAGEAA